MYCRFCGAEINNQSKFCNSCGRPQDLVKKSSTNNWLTVLHYIIGVFFILGGVLPYLLQGDLAEYNSYISLLDAKYSSPTTFVAISYFIQFSSFLSSLFYFSSSVLAVYIGLLLLKKESKLTVAVITCTIVHIFSIIYSGVVNLLVYCFPKFVLSLYTSETSIVTAGEDIIKTEPDVLYYYQDNAICRLIISGVLVALAVIFLYIKKQYLKNVTADNIKTSSIGSIVMILSISVLSVVSTVMSISLRGIYGNYAVTAISVAKFSFDLNISSIVFLCLLFIIGIAVIFTRTKRWLLALPTISIIVILGFIAFLCSNVFIRDMVTEKTIFVLAVDDFQGMVFSSVVVLIATFYWFSSVSRNKIPTWLQIALPLLLPFLYIGIEIITNNILHLYLSISCGLIGISLITVIVSLLVRSNKQSATENI